jgi:DNA-binding XRE family transcriptional regulator
MSFQITLKAARVNAGFRIIDAAKLIGIGKDTLIKWEKNSGLVNPIMQQKISFIYKIPIEHIFFGKTLEFNSRKSEKEHKYERIIKS